MRWPVHPIETVRPSRFVPPFCPWPDCPVHRHSGSKFHRHGSYHRQSDRRPVPRFRCTTCRQTCSRQTFSTTYYLKRPDLLRPVASGLVACSAHRQIARSLACAKTTVTRLSDRLGRHAILFHSRSLSRLVHPNEPIVHDHFETFLQRQDQALGVGTAVGARSRFVYDLDPAPHRGAGRKPDRWLRSVRGHSSPSPYVASVERTIRVLLSIFPMDRSLTLVVDGRQDYRTAQAQSPDPNRIALRVFPNPERGPKRSPRSPEAIQRDRAMSPVDQLHQLIRHSCGDHKRETIAFGRRLESVLGRLTLLAVWRNFVKHRSERKPDRTTPAMHVGLATSPWTWERLLSRRLFPGRETATEAASKTYFRRWTPGASTFQRRHAG